MAKVFTLCDRIDDYDIEDLVILIVSSPSESEVIQEHLVTCEKHKTLLDIVRKEVFFTHCPKGESLNREYAKKLAKNYHKLGIHA